MNSTPPSSESSSMSTLFLDKLQSMQPTAWSRLVETYSPIIYSWCRKSGLSAHDASDVVQDVFASVAKGIHRFRRDQAKSSFRAWLSTVTRTRIADFYRSHLTQPHGLGGTDAYQQLVSIPELSDDSSSAASMHTSLTHRTLELIRDEFEPKTWTAFWRTAIENRTPSETAAELSMSLASVYQSRSRVLRRLRQRLAELP